MHTAPMTSAQLLQGVSRSFSLSLRWLPSALRGPVGLAYLLARITDTVADTSGVPVAQRLALLTDLQAAMDQPQAPAALAPALAQFAAQVQHPHESALLRQGTACLQALSALTPADQATIREVLAAITEGQRWDLCTLDSPGAGPQTDAEVDRYTWQVAGSVGEFWTRMCALHLTHWHNSHPDDMLQWGAAYGQGLQRLNILRDAHQDLQNGRCYFAAQDLAACGLDRQRLCAAVQARQPQAVQALAPLLHDWHARTEGLLHQGLRYSLALQTWRLRLASALPCLIGIRTLTLLRQAGVAALWTHVKWPRHEVRKLLWTLLLTGASPRQLQRSWDAGLAKRPSA